MLSRASSDAGARLRHAKSTSSGLSHGKSAAAEPSDPFVVREHATAAAVEAFERAYAIGRTRSSAERSLDLARHKSNASRGSQGSHFPPRGSSLRQAGEDSAARRRKSTQAQRLSHEKQQNNRPNIAAGLAATPQQPVRDIVPTCVVSAPPMPRDVVLIAAPMVPPATPVSKQVRKSRSMYNSWSFGIGSSREPRKDASMDLRRSSNQKDKDNRSPSASSFSPGDNAASQAPSGTPGADEIAAARDRCLQDFQKHKLRTRPSFVFTPFKKRQDKQQQQQPTVTSDNSPSPHDTPPFEIAAPAANPARLEEKRSLSGSLRTKFKKVFRKTSKPAISLPVQQVDASRAYFGNSNQKTPGEGFPHTGTATPVDIFTNEVSRSESSQRKSSDVSYRSRESTEGHDMDVSRSRVTSWTNSSATNSVNHLDAKRLSIIPEVEASSERTRYTSSILSRSPFKKPVHTSPRAPAKGPDSFDVFSALKSRLERAGLDSNLDPDLPNPSSQALHEKTERATLPSQMRVGSNTSSRLSRATKATIRTVTPEAFGRSRSKDGTSNGHQQIEDDEEAGSDSPEDDDDGGGLVLPRIRLQRASKATMPTPEQIASRKKKSENRWQAQLQQGHSPVFSKNIKRAMAGANPYELTLFEHSPSPSKSVEALPRTCSHKAQEPVDMLNPGWPSRADIMSPSVYSRDSTGESPVRKESDGANCPPGTVVIVSSHSAKSYTLGSPPKPGAAVKSLRSSKDWKSWLSKEVSELDLTQDFDMSMTEEWLLKPARHQREHAEIVGVGDDDDEVVIFRSRPGSSAFPTRPDRLTLVDPLAVTTDEPDEAKVGDETSPQAHDTFATAAESKKNGHCEVSEAADQNHRSNQRGSGPDGEVDKAPEMAPIHTPEPEEKIPLSTLTDHRLRSAPSIQSIQRSAGRSHSSLAQYTTSAEDPDMPPQAPTISAPSANLPFRFRPAAAAAAATTNTDPFSNRASPFSRPRSSFDLHNQPSSNAQLRSTGCGPAPTLTTTTVSGGAGGSLLPPPPPHHHLRHKPVTLGGAGRRGARLTPSPTPHPSLESETMRQIMQGPYGGGSGPEPPPSSSTPPWIPPPPLPPQPSTTPTPLRHGHAWTRGSGSPAGAAAAPLTTRQSTPALRVTPRPSSARLAALNKVGNNSNNKSASGRKENASPLSLLLMTTPGSSRGVQEKGEDASTTTTTAGSGSERGLTPSPGQLLAERWLSARQARQARQARDGRGVSPAFL